MIDDKAKEFARKLLQDGVDQIKKTGNLTSAIVLDRSESGAPVSFIPIIGPLMNDKHAKAAISEMVREIIAKNRYQLVFMVSDQYSLSMSPEEEQNSREIRTTMDLREIHEKLGIGSLVEEVSVMVEDPIKLMVVRCPYKRDADRSVVSVGEVEEVLDDHPRATGRFIFFDHSRNELKTQPRAEA